MGINLVKGQKIDLTKDSKGLDKIMVGLGWDPIKKKGLLGTIFGHNMDCDASVILLNGKGKMRNIKDLIYFRNLQNSNRSIVHMGDNLTGAGDGDDEQIMLDLQSIPKDIHKAVFVVNIYDCKARDQHFGMVQNAYIRVVDSVGKNEVCKFNLAEDYSGKTTLIVGEVYRNNSEWKFNAIGEATNDESLSQIIEKYK